MGQAWGPEDARNILYLRPEENTRPERVPLHGGWGVELGGHILTLQGEWPPT